MKHRLNERQDCRVVLASASPRRKELLEQIGIEAEIRPSRTEEVITGSDPAQTVKELSQQKAAEVAARIGADGETVVIGADTVVSIDGQILGKPASREEAADMIRRLQGTVHHVYTGVTLIRGSQKSVFASESSVEVYPMTEEEIESYLDTGESMDKAGAYGIQGRFAAYIRELRGSYTNVMGLPVGRLYQELKKITEKQAEEER